MMNNIKAVIIDDEVSARNTLKKFLTAYCPEIIVLAEAGSVKEGIKTLGDHSPEIVFLDVQMQDGSGFDLLQGLTEINFEVIFITGYDGYAIKAIKYSAIDYLLKPLVPDELQAAVSRAIKKRKDFAAQPAPPKPQIKGRIAVPDSEGLKVIELNKIIYCKAEGNYTQFVLTDQRKILVCKTLKEYDTALPPTFIRIHSAYLINLEHVKTYVKGRGGQVEMSNGDFLDVARNRKQAFLDVLMGGDIQ